MFIPKGKKLLDPKIDSTFKTIFTKDGESSQVALRSLVGAIIGHEPDEVTVVGNELPVEVMYAKSIRLDLQCRMKDGSHIALEMQTCPSNDNLKERSLYYGSRIVSGLDMKGRFYSDLPRVYQVMFTNFPLFGQGSNFIQTFTMRNSEEELSDNLKIIFIQMPLLDARYEELENLPELEKWVIFLREGSEPEKRELLNRLMASSKGIKEAGEILMTISDDEREWFIQESRYKAQMDYESGLLLARHDGKEEGREEGLAEGEQIGEKHGLETAARGMKAENIPLETIVKITGLTPEQIAAL